MLAIERGAHLFDAVNPYGHHRHRHDGIGLRGQVVVWNVHIRLPVIGARNCNAAKITLSVLRNVRFVTRRGLS